MKKLLTATAMLASVLSLSACQSMSTDSTTASQPVLKSKITSVDGNNIYLGDMFLRPVDGGVQVYGQLKGFRPGSTVAVHIHETGSCANGGEAAGGHFNPTNKPHGHPNSSNSHAGDLPNVTANAAGVASMNFVNKNISVAMTGSNSVYRRSFIVHNGIDDYTSQPSGNAGARIACGVIETY